MIVPAAFLFRQFRKTFDEFQLNFDGCKRLRIALVQDLCFFAEQTDLVVVAIRCESHPGVGEIMHGIVEQELTGLVILALGDGRQGVLDRQLGATHFFGFDLRLGQFHDLQLSGLARHWRLDG